MCLPKAEGGCGAVSILMEPTDEAVDRMVVDQLETPDMAATLRARRRDHDAGDEAAMLAELHQLKQRTDENAADRASGAISRAAYLATQQAIDRQTEILSKRLADQRQAEPLDALAAGNGLVSALADRYRGLPAERRRRVIEALAERITVLPVDDPTYLERLQVTLTEEAAEYRAEAAELRARAKQAPPDDAQPLRRQAEKRDADARRRGRQIARNGNAMSVFRVERLDPVWRT
jgi:hypothetical protein